MKTILDKDITELQDRKKEKQATYDNIIYTLVPSFERMCADCNIDLKQTAPDFDIEDLENIFLVHVSNAKLRMKTKMVEDERKKEEKLAKLAEAKAKKDQEDQEILMLSRKDLTALMTDQFNSLMKKRSGNGQGNVQKPKNVPKNQNGAQVRGRKKGKENGGKRNDRSNSRGKTTA